MQPRTRCFAATASVLSCLTVGCGSFLVSAAPAQENSPAELDTATGAVLRAYARYSFYTTERTAEVVCEIGLPEADLAASVLVAKDSAGRKLAESKDVEPRTLLSIPIAERAPGDIAISVDWQRQNGKLLGRAEVTLLKRPPKPGCEWKIDRADKVILNNGTPFFPFGVMIKSRYTTNETVMVKDIADAGFNSIVRFSGAPFARIEQLLDIAKRHGIYVVEHPNEWQYQESPGEEPEPPMPPNAPWSHDVYARVQFDWRMNHVWLPGASRIMNHPNLMAYYLRDEPRGREMAAALLRLYHALNKLDGYHPSQILYIPPVPTGDEYTDNCDILGVDPYWVPGGDKPSSDNPLVVARSTWMLRQRGDRDRKLAWITPCAESFSRTELRLFVESEQRVQTYLSLIQGARGLIYFVYPFVHQSTYDTFVRLGREMKILGPACAAPDVPQTIRYTPVAFEPLKNIYPDVQVALKKNPAGGYILLAANWKPYPVDVKFTVSCLGDPGTVRLLFDKTTEFPVKGKSFADKMAAMDTRAYALEGFSDQRTPVEIEAALTAYPDKSDAFLTAKGLPPSGAPGKKNILRNSGFEACGIPGMPDYYRDIRTATTALGIRSGDPRGDCGWRVDTNRPFEGKHSLRLDHTKGVKTFFLFGTSPELTKKTPFTFSAWIRSDRENGASFSFYGPNLAGKPIPLTADWQRFEVLVFVPPKLPWAGHTFGFYTSAADSNTVWIDAMQLEQGMEMTEYEP